MNKELQEAINYFDKFVNAALTTVDSEEFGSLEVVKNYSVIKGALAEVLSDKD